MLQIVILIAFLGVSVATLGDGLWRTFAHQKELPISSAAAAEAGWVAVSTTCDPNLGFLWAQDISGVSEKHPLGLYYNLVGQISGVQATLYGSNTKVGNAAPDNLVKNGYWKVDDNNSSWHIDISFRASSAMCSDSGEPDDLIGDRVVINQDTIKQAIPLTVTDAQKGNWTPGSCMTSMGWHHFYDLSSAPKQSWQEDELLPVVPMYNPPDSTGKLNAFFFTSPVAQPGSGARYLLTGAADWESPALIQPLMCQNWCDDSSCAWNTPSWATMHIYVSSAWKDLTCPGGSGPVGRSCQQCEDASVQCAPEGEYLKSL